MEGRKDRRGNGDGEGLIERYREGIGEGSIVKQKKE